MKRELLLLFTVTCSLTAVATRSAGAEVPTCSSYQITYEAGDLERARDMALAAVANSPKAKDGSSYVILNNVVDKYGWKTALSVISRDCKEQTDEGELPNLDDVIHELPWDAAFNRL